MQDKILIIDFGSQVTQLIARRVREAQVYCEIHPYTISLDKIKAFGAKAIILSGGPSSVGGKFSPTIDKEIFDLGIPVLGICYGEQLICDLLDGKVESADTREFGRAEIQIIKDSPLLDGIKNKQIWMSHGDKVVEIPAGFEVIAKTSDAPFAAIANEQDRIYGVQFHPEVTHTTDGAVLLSNFVHKIAGCKNDWNMHDFITYETEKIKKLIGSKNVIAGVSGGVDSSVAATLLHRSIGDQLKCIFVNTGVLRKGEAEQVQQMFKDDLKIPLDYVDATKIFMDKLQGVSDPEQKRKIIGATFIDIFEDEANKVGNADFLMQGTLYPDVIESVSVHGDASVTIKSHHNVGGLPERMKLSLVEPLRELFKDEVRQLGHELGLSQEVIGRHPFPGPGLTIRILGEITEEKIKTLQEADDIYINAIKEEGLYDEIWQAFAVLLPVKTVGVMGDARTYENVLALRAVTSNDGMTADFYPFDPEFLGRLTNKIVNNVRGINRVTYDYTSKPPGTIEWE